MTKKIALKVPLKNAQKAIELLKQKSIFEFGFIVLKSKKFIYLPLNKKPIKAQKTQIQKSLKESQLISKNFKEKKTQSRSLKQALEGKLSKKEFSHLIRAFDFLGSIAIIEIPQALEKKQKTIAEALLSVNKSIKTVCKITGEHQGKFRIQPVKVLAGKKTFIAEYKESNCRMLVDISKVFFSPRLSRERLRIAKKIKKPETVGVFFAGVGPFALVFAKNSKMKKTIAIELNPDAVKLLKKNISLNKCEKKIQPIKGDVNKVCKKFPQAFDRIVMPLPETGEHFLEAAFTSIKSGGTIHFYQFTPKLAPYEEPLKKIRSIAKKFNKKVSIKRKAQVRTFSAKKIQVVIDFLVK